MTDCNTLHSYFRCFKDEINKRFLPLRAADSALMPIGCEIVAQRDVNARTISGTSKL